MKIIGSQTCYIYIVYIMYIMYIYIYMYITKLCVYVYMYIYIYITGSRSISLPPPMQTCHFSPQALHGFSAFLRFRIQWSVATGLVHLILEGREVGGSEISQLLQEDVPSLTHVPEP